MMLSREAITAAVEAHLEARDFYKPAHGVDLRRRATRCTAGASRSTRSRSPRSCAGAGQLDALGGRPTLLRIQAATPASANAAHYAQIVAELAMLRRLIETAGDIQEMAYAADDDVDETLDRAEALIFEVAERRVADSLVQLLPGARADARPARALYDRDGDDHRRPDRLPRPRRAAARPAAVDAHRSSRPVPVRARRRSRSAPRCTSRCTARKPVLFFSMEMGHLELTKRLLAAEAQSTSRKLSDRPALRARVAEAATRPSAGSPKRRSSSTTTRTAR